MSHFSVFRISLIPIFLSVLGLCFSISTPALGESKGKTDDKHSEQQHNDCFDDEDGRDKTNRPDRIRFDIPMPGIQNSLWPDGSVSMAIPLHNASELSADQVTLTGIEVPGGKRFNLAALPAVIGDLPPDAVSKVDARFGGLKVGRKYPVKVQGTYETSNGLCKFHVQSFVTPHADDNRPVKATVGTILKTSPETANYPSPPPPPGPEQEFNAFGFLPPIGPPRNFFPNNPPGSTLLVRRAAFNLDQQTPPAAANSADANSVVFTRNTIGATYGGFPPDPSVAGSDQNDIAMFTANTAVSYSTDGGLTFKTVNLFSLTDPAIPARKSFFPEDDGGLCCDQVLHYIPKRNIFVWLLQYWPKTIGTDATGNPIKGPSRLRVAWATPQDIKNDFLHAWTWVDLTSAGVGLGNDWMDFPDIAYSNNFVYVGVDHAIQNTGSVYTGRHIFVRLSLDDIVNASIPYVTYGYMDPTHGGLFQNHIAQSSPDTFYWTAMPDTSTMTVYAWPDSSNTATPHDVPISSYKNSDFSILTPEGIDFSAAPKLTLGATVVDPFFLCPDGGCPGPTRFLYFAFSAGRNGAGRPFPYVRVEKIDRDTFKRVSELDIWNPNFGFTMPALVWNPNSYKDEVALSLAVGGGGSFANNAVGFLNDFVVYVTTDSDTTHAGYATDKNGQFILDSNGHRTYSVRFGDYYSLRNSIGPKTENGRGVGYSTLGYAAKTLSAGKKCVDVGCRIDEHYIQFGRYSDLIPPPPSPSPR